MATPHIESKKEEIAKVVLMPGDPLRAKFIAETFLENYRLVNTVRNMFAYTGTYKGKEVTVFSSGMGNPSMGIYSYELFKFYDVDTIIRVGSAGAYTDKLNLYDLVLVESSYSESSYARVQGNVQGNIMYSNKEVNSIIENKANELGLKINKGTVHCSDVFYKENDNFEELNRDHNCIAVEMETFALFHNANVTGKRASAIITISDSLVTNEATTSEQRQNSFVEMIRLALESAIEL